MNRRRAHNAVALVAILLSLAACTRDGPDQFLASGRDYLARAEYSAASIQLRNAVQAQPDSGEARLLLGQALLRANDPLSAEKELRRALELGRSADDVLPLLAQAMLGSGKADALVREYSDTLPQAAAPRARFQAALGDAHAVLGRREEAERSYRAALASDPANGGAKLGLAQLEAQAGKLESALAATQEVIAAEPQNAQARALKSDILVARRDVAGAKQELEQAVKADPTYLPARYAYVSMLIQEGSHDSARAQLDDLQKIAADDIRLVYFHSVLALQRGDVSAARDRVSQILKAAPDHVPSLVLASKIEMQAQQYASAEAHLRRALAQAPQHPEALRLLAASYLRSGQSAKASQALQPLLADNGRADPQVLLLAGETSLATGDVKQAAAYYQRAAAAGQKTEAAAAHTRLGQIAFASGRQEDGLKELESAASADPSFRQTDLALVSTHLRNGDMDKALAAAKSLEKKNPKDAMSHQVLGMVHLARKDQAAARKSFEQALQLNAGLVPAARALAELDIADGKADGARRRYESMIERDPRNATLHLAMAELQLRTGAKAADVVPTLQNAVASDPSSVDARLALISAFARTGNTRGALTAAEEAAAAHPASPQVLQMLAILQSEVGDHNQSLETMRRLTRAQPGVPAPLQRIAAAQSAKKQYEQAAATLRMAKEVAPNDASVSRDLIVLYLSAGRPDDALKEARAVQATAPRSSAGWLLESQVHETQKRFGDAEAALRQGLKIEPTSGILAARLHGSLLAAGKPAEAEGFARKWLVEHPKDTAMRLELGQRAISAKNHVAAASHYQAVLSADADNVVALNNLAWIGGQSNDPKAIAYAERAVRLAPDSAPVLDTMGTLLLAKGDTRRAVDYLARAARIAPERVDIRLNYAKGLARAGQKGEARRELEALLAIPNEFPGKSEATALLKTL